MMTTSLTKNTALCAEYSIQNSHKVNVSACVLAGVLMMTCNSANAVEDFSIDTLSLAYTSSIDQDTVNGRGTDDGKKYVFQYEHFGTNPWGSLYADIEYNHGDGVGAIPQLGDGGDAHDFYGVIIPSVSLSKTTGKSFTWGPISDVSLIGMYRASDYANYRSWGYGVTLNFEVPGFQWFESGILTHNSDWYVEPETFDTNTGRNYPLDEDEWMWRTYMIAKPILIGEERFRANAFITVNGTESQGTAVFARLEATWEILGHSDYQIGIRYEYVKHKNDLSLGFGENSYDQHTPYLIFKYAL